ncbi:MAG: NADH-quinone oxidoreductase subunit F [Dehalococcoidia bacterium]|nr:NADH-quinone oxidoreductase subunit F [Dehalococcoidia bacterium]
MDYTTLRAAARRRWNRRHSGKLRIAVQVAHCSQAVGAAQVAATLRDAVERHSLNAEVVETGCDGACFLAPRLSIAAAATAARPALSADAVWLSRVTLLRAEAIVETLATTRMPPSDPGPDRFFSAQTRRITERFGHVDPADVDDYIVRGGYEGLCKALAMTPEQVIEQVLASGLQGRGGAYFPAAQKWRAARAHANVARYLVVNAEEGEPGIFKDRHIMEAEPHRLIEGAVIAAYAAGAERVFLYINAEADLSAARVARALEQAYALKVLGDDVLGSGVRVHAEIRRGAGGYVCGDETTLLNTVEGDRRVPRLRPPFPTDAGLWGKPTVINNVETLSNVPFVMTQGAAAFASVGLDNAKGTKLISLSGAVQRPGLAEAPIGTTLRHIIYEIGGGPLPGHTLTAIACGGPSSGVLPPSMLDTPLRPGQIHGSGVIMGAGGVIVVDERTRVIDVVRKQAWYNANESCGKCTPCREGTPKMAVALDRLASGQGKQADLDELRELAEVVGAASLCGLGQAAGGPINSWLQMFGEEMRGLAGVR